jgi:aminoglycoside phosphotransferase (APT) family kinase protein
LLRHFANAVYLLDHAPIVARLGYGPHAVTKATTAVAVTRWLNEQDFPATEPADLPSGAEQPLISLASGRSVVTTFWHHYPQPTGTDWPDTGALGRITAALHELPTPPIALPGFQPLRTLTATVHDPAARLALTEDQHAWLVDRINMLRATFENLDFPLGRGLIHGDMYTGNLLWNTADPDHPVVLGDWDSVCIGPREIDLIPTYAEARFGVDPATVDTFALAYGHDLQRWAGYDVLYDIRELSTLTALVRLAPGNERLKAELAHRLGLLRQGDRATPWHGQ